jgi:hypothetical protein
MSAMKAAALLLLLASCSPSPRPAEPPPPASPSARVVSLHSPGGSIHELAIGDQSTYALDLHDPGDCAAVHNTKGALHVSLVFRGPGYGDGQEAVTAANKYANAYVGKPVIESVAIYDGDNPVPFFDGPPKTADVTVRRDGDVRHARVVLVVDAPAVKLSYDGEIALCPTAADPVADAGVAPPVASSACPASWSKGGGLCTPSGKVCEFPEGPCTCAGQSYCGGAAPTQEILKELAVPRWMCTPSPKAIGPDGCPLVMPHGGKCAPNGKKCHYTPCCAFTVTCTNGKWLSDGGNCPP